MVKGSDLCSMNANIVCVDLTFLIFLLCGRDAPNMLEVNHRYLTCENRSETQKTILKYSVVAKVHSML